MSEQPDQPERRQTRPQLRRGGRAGVIAVVAVLAILVAMVVVWLVTRDDSGGTQAERSGAHASHQRTGRPSSSSASGEVSPSAVSVPARVLDQVGVGDAAGAPQPIRGAAIPTPDARPRVMYVGAEYCPYCAAQRWALVVALSRFGTWKGLQPAESSATDVYPSTPTISFVKASYTSRYLSFIGYEVQDSEGQPLQQMPRADEALFSRLNRPPYVSADSAGAIPFVLYGKSFVGSGSQVNPEVLQDKTRTEIAAALRRPSDPIAKSVDASANVITAALCRLTEQRPARVCQATGVRTAARMLR